MLESQLQTKILKELKKVGWFYKASDRFRAGIPDVIGCIKGTFVALELKVEPRKVTPLQLHELTNIYREGGNAQVVSYNNKTKLYKAYDTEHETMGDLIKCILRHVHLSIKNNASKT